MAINNELSEATHLINSNVVKQLPGEKLRNCIVAVYERHPLEDPHKAARRASKASGAAISAIAKVPYIPISLKLGKILGPVAVVGNTAGFFILEYWAISGMADDAFGPKTQAEIELLYDENVERNGICRKGRTIVVISLASLVALSAQLPTALAGVDYNSEQYKIVAGAVLLVAGSLIPMRSLQLTIEQIRLCSKRTVESEITAIKAKMIGLIRESQGVFLKESYSKKVRSIQRCNEVSQLDASVTEKTDQYMLAMLQRDPVPVNKAKRMVGTVCDYTGFAVGTALAGIFEFAIGQYTYELSKQEIWDNDVAGGVFAALAVGSTAYLYGRSIIRTTQRVFNLTGNMATFSEVRNLGWQLRPKLSFALTAVGLLTDVCALGPTYVIWGNFYDENEVEHQLFQKAMCASLFLLLFTSTLDIIDEVVASSIANGTEEEQAILKLNGEFQKLAELIAKSSSLEFIGYLTNLDAVTREDLLERMNISAHEFAVLCSPELEV